MKRRWWTYASTIETAVAYIAKLIAAGTWGDCRPRAMTERCGVHSGFRRCCVRFYVDRWMDPTWSAEGRRPHEVAMRQYWNHWTAKKRIGTWCSSDPARMGYVPCPTCIGRNLPPRQVRQCRILDRATGLCEPV